MNKLKINEKMKFVFFIIIKKEEKKNESKESQW